MKTVPVFCKESFFKSAVPGQVVSSILSHLQWYVVKHLCWEVGVKKRAQCSPVGLRLLLSWLTM